MKLTVRILALLLTLLLLLSGCSTVEDNTIESSSTTETSFDNKPAWVASWEAGARGGVLYEGIDATLYRSLEEYSFNKDLRYPSDKQKYYNIIDENKMVPVALLNDIEFLAVVDIIEAITISNSTSSLNGSIVITAGDFNKVKPIPGIKVLKDNGDKYAYNLYRYNGITICIMYYNLGGVLRYNEVFIFDEIQSYDDLKNNLTMTYEEGKNTKKELYELNEELARISDDAFRGYSDVSRYTTHMTDKGFLIIAYKNKNPHQVKYSYLAEDVNVKLHKSLLMDMLLDSQFTGKE